MKRDVVERERRSCRRDRRLETGHLHHLEVAGERSAEAVAELVALDRGEEADRAEVEAEDGHVGARVGAQRLQDRAVAAEHETEVGLPVERRRAARGRRRRRRACRALVLGRIDRAAGSFAARDGRAHGLGGLLGLGVGEQDRARSRPAATGRSLTARPRSIARSQISTAAPARARRTNVSRLPFGPGSPRTRSRARRARHRRPRSATARSASRRSSGSRTTPPLPTRSGPSSNCGLTRASSSPSAADACGDGRHHLGERDERDVDGRQDRPRRQLAGIECRERFGARPRRRAGRFAASSRAGRAPTSSAITRGRAALQQAVGEAAGRGADVEAIESRDVEPERLERVLELDPAPGDERRRLASTSSSASSATSWLGLLAQRAVAPDPHPPGAHRLAALRPRARQPALGEQRCRSGGGPSRHRSGGVRRAMRQRPGGRSGAPLLPRHAPALASRRPMREVVGALSWRGPTRRVRSKLTFANVCCSSPC